MLYYASTHCDSFLRLVFDAASDAYDFLSEVAGLFFLTVFPAVMGMVMVSWRTLAVAVFVVAAVVRGAP